MSNKLRGGFFGRKSEPPRHQTWDPYQDHGLRTARTNTPFMAFPGEQSQIVNVHIESKETPEAHVYKAHLPGLNRSDVRVEVDDRNVLSIICEKSVEKEEHRGGWYLMEQSSGHFVQRLNLPENSNVDHVKAHMDDGVLTITVPKHRVLNNRVRNINISHVNV
ncbi:18.1 kDa class I heat shock protein-like [Gastrolobium bilobum]|uniref:18.1 kDa class I heat shock protein-like n=1 Tax=Gastrolobium bilobum TaxID=150636 RepID=UPI002AAF0EEA|nr:18.1 kDa class I heat shock protein-like [Gastrolobium bilobum]